MASYLASALFGSSTAVPPVVDTPTLAPEVAVQEVGTAPQTVVQETTVPQPEPVTVLAPTSVTLPLSTEDAPIAVPVSVAESVSVPVVESTAVSTPMVPAPVPNVQTSGDAVAVTESTPAPAPAPATESAPAPVAPVPESVELKTEVELEMSADEDGSNFSGYMIDTNGNRREFANLKEAVSALARYAQLPNFASGCPCPKCQSKMVQVEQETKKRDVNANLAKVQESTEQDAKMDAEINALKAKAAKLCICDKCTARRKKEREDSATPVTETKDAEDQLKDAEDLKNRKLEFFKDLAKYVSSKCNCANCTARRTAEAKAKTEEELKTTSPTPVLVPESTPVETESTPDTVAKTLPKPRSLLDILDIITGKKSCDCPDCTARRAVEATKAKAEAETKANTNADAKVDITARAKVDITARALLDIIDKIEGKKSCDCPNCTALRTKFAKVTSAPSLESLPAFDDWVEGTLWYNPCNCADCTARRAAKRNPNTTETKEQVQTVTSFQPRSGCECALCIEFTTKERVKAKQAQQNTLPVIEESYINKNDTERKKDATTPVTPSSPASSSDDSSPDQTAPATSMSKTIASFFKALGKNPYTRYPNAYAVEKKDFSCVPLMNKRIRFTVAPGVDGKSSKIAAYGASEVRTGNNVTTELIERLFNTELIKELVFAPGKKKTLQATVRFLPDTRTLRNRSEYVPSIYAPALIGGLKTYMARYSSQDTVRFHDDGFGYDVFADFTTAF